uniref:Secreted protein n=1 Tax=Sciurus vulgaris TaxID=55149 RepID=A0A8D2AJC2_SCIVU
MYLKPSLFLVLYFLSGKCKEVVLNKFKQKWEAQRMAFVYCLWSLRVRLFEAPVTASESPLKAEAGLCSQSSHT